MLERPVSLETLARVAAAWADPLDAPCPECGLDTRSGEALQTATATTWPFKCRDGHQWVVRLDQAVTVVEVDG